MKHEIESIHLISNTILHMKIKIIVHIRLHSGLTPPELWFEPCVCVCVFVYTPSHAPKSQYTG